MFLAEINYSAAHSPRRTQMTSKWEAVRVCHVGLCATNSHCWFWRRLDRFLCAFFYLPGASFKENPYDHHGFRRSSSKQRLTELMKAGKRRMFAGVWTRQAGSHTSDWCILVHFTLPYVVGVCVFMLVYVSSRGSVLPAKIIYRQFPKSLNVSCWLTRCC